MRKPAFIKGSISKRLLLLGIIFSIVPVIAMALIIYLTVENRMIAEIEKTNRNTMNQMRERIEDAMSQVDRMIVQGIHSQRLNLELYSAGEFARRDLDDISMLLASLEELLDHAEEVSIYIPEAKRRITSQGIYEDNADPMSRYLVDDGWAANAPFLWYETTSEAEIGGAGQRLTGLVLVRKIPVASEEPYGYFIVQLNEDLFARIFDQMRLGSSGGMFLLSPSGNRYAEPALDDWLLERKDYEKALEVLLSSGRTAAGEFAVWGSGKEKLFIQWIESPINGWKYAGIVPYAEITAPLRTIYHMMWATCVVVAGIAFVFLLRLYYRAAGRLNMLLGRMNGKLISSERGIAAGDELGQIESYMERIHNVHERLEHRWLSSYPDLEAYYLRKWLTEPYSERLRDSLMKYGLYRKDCLYVAFCMQWDVNPLEPSTPARLQIEDVVLTLSGIEWSHMGSRLVRIDNDRIGGILEVDRNVGAAGFKACVEAALHKHVATASKVLKQFIVVGAGDSAVEAADIANHFRQASEALRRRLIDGGKPVIFTDETASNPDVFRYPAQQEQSLISAIYIGDGDQAFAALEGFGATLSKENELSNEQLVHAYSLLVSALLRAGNSSGNGFTMDQPLFRANIFETLSRMKRVDQIHLWLKEELLEPIAEWSAQRMAGQSEEAELIQQAINYIHDHADQDLSLKKVAELVGLREVQFSVVFKQQSGLTYTDYVIAHRIERAKALLVQTDLKIAEIAQRISYGNSQNFIRLFKQKTGMTPGEFRKSNKASDNGDCNQPDRSSR